MLIHKKGSKKTKNKTPKFQRSKFPVSFKKNQSQSELEKGFPPNSPSIHPAFDKEAEKVLGGQCERKVGSKMGSWNGGTCHQADSP